MLFNNQNLNPVVAEFAVNPVAAKRKHEAMKKVFSYSVAGAVVAGAMLYPEIAMAGGLDKANKGLEQFITDVKPFIRTFAVVALMLTAAGYMAGMLDKSKFILIVAGLLIIGAAPDIVDMFWSK